MFIKYACTTERASFFTVCAIIAYALMTAVNECENFCMMERFFNYISSAFIAQFCTDEDARIMIGVNEHEIH
jgi:hypothetical protein